MAHAVFAALESQNKRDRSHEKVKRYFFLCREVIPSSASHNREKSVVDDYVFVGFTWKQFSTCVRFSVVKFCHEQH